MQALIVKRVVASCRIHGGTTSSVASISVRDSSVNNAAATSLQNEAAWGFTSGNALHFITAASYRLVSRSIIKRRQSSKPGQTAHVCYLQPCRGRCADVHPRPPKSFTSIIQSDILIRRYSDDIICMCPHPQWKLWVGKKMYPLRRHE